jgi:hypothetical protein
MFVRDRWRSDEAPPRHRVTVGEESLIMTNTKKLSFIALCAALAVPAIASADRPRDRDRDRDRDRWTRIGEVGTHAHDAEDFVPVNSNERFESIELKAEGRPVRMDGVRVQYTDGREYRADVNWVLRPGERVMVDIPAYSPVKMLILDYDNPGRHWRAREESTVEVRGLSFDDRRDDRDRYDNRDRGYSQRDRRTDRRDDDRRATDTRFEWRGGIYVRVR